MLRDISAEELQADVTAINPHTSEDSGYTRNTLIRVPKSIGPEKLSRVCNFNTEKHVSPTLPTRKSNEATRKRSVLNYAVNLIVLLAGSTNPFLGLRNGSVIGLGPTG
jgi:hypothetical protein